MTPEYKAQLERSFRQLSDAMKPLIERDAQKICSACKALRLTFSV